LIGLIGILLAGIGFITSIFTKDKRIIINEISKEGVIENILVSFEFLAFIIGIQVFEFFLIYLCLYSPQKLVSSFYFYIITIMSIYFFVFTIFYTISLIGNCIQIHSILNNLDKGIYIQKDLLSKANEVRIDFILKLILNNTEPQTFRNELLKYVENSTMKNKEEVKKYLENYYK